MNFKLNYSLDELRKMVEAKGGEQIEPYAFIRFSNEEITIKASLESIVPFFKKGIICYHDPLPGIAEDKSLQIVQDFIAKNPGFRLVKYPFYVLYHNMEGMYNRLYNNGTSKFWLLHYYYQFALEQLIELAKENGDYDRAWIFKVDCDHVYSQKLLEYTKLCCELEVYEQGITCAYFYKMNVRRHPETKEVFLDRIENSYDHTCAKLTTAAPFMLVVNAYFSEDKAKGRHKTQIYELQRFYEGYKCLGNKVFLNSMHFDREKFFYYQENTPEQVAENFVNGVEYQKLDWEKMVAQLPEAKIDPEFFSYENVQSILASFNYPADFKQNLKYGRNQFKLNDFFTNPDYRPEKYIEEHNRRWANKEQMEAGPELAELERMQRILKLLTREGYLPDIYYMEGAYEFLEGEKE
ncbi:hypothetical protein [Psittacicella gerlachiana]|uniref:Uncharacterized protein n=1 Tax=Psittacicella gerlachiana TaxID=2028574 RepID=A0A3A1YJH3_9GAMM|nr:hypothetical protein [Psittacicella gerlachiana]RIY38423.1 hypothetical protein CKF59_01000 [Psittacicella gerlachiana]